jgi:hypothetical protein
LGREWSLQAQARPERNSYTRDHAAAFDNNGYWFCEKGEIKGPFKLPKPGVY